MPTHRKAATRPAFETNLYVRSDVKPVKVSSFFTLLVAHVFSCSYSTNNLVISFILGICEDYS